MEIRRNFFTLRVLQHWNKLSRDKGELSSVEAFKAWPEKPAAVLTHISSNPALGRRLEQITSRNLFQCAFFYDSETVLLSLCQTYWEAPLMFLFMALHKRKNKITTKELCHRNLNCCGSSGSGQMCLFLLELTPVIIVSCCSSSSFTTYILHSLA